ncbi:N-acetyltransferase [Herbaspirillum huttiense]|nr:N-acetyltransferase [Herbaspirillum huttiense]
MPKCSLLTLATRHLTVPMIFTSRLALQDFQDRDLSAIFSFMSDQQAMQFTHKAQSPEALLRRLRSFESQRSSNGFAPWVVRDRRDFKVIGWGGLCTDPDEPGWGIEVIYAFSPDKWRRGYASELVQTASQYAFHTCHIGELHAFAMPANTGSLRVLEKCGFQNIGYVQSLEREHLVLKMPMASTANQEHKLMRISLEDPRQEEVIKLIEELDAYQVPLYPAESHHGIDLDALASANVLFAVVRDDDGQAVACGAIVLQQHYGELKRFYTSPLQRGKGIARTC